MAFQLAPLAAGLAAFLPGLLAIFVLYGPYDGYFRDNIVFLWFVGGLLAGTFAALLNAWVLALAAPLVYVVGAPLVEQGAKLVFLNRRKWHGERQVVWNGGAMGAGVGTMVALVVSIQTFAGGFSWLDFAVVVGLASGIGFTHVATGLALGAGVVNRKPFPAYAIAAAAAVPLAALLALKSQADRLIGFEAAPLILAALAVAYGVALLLVARKVWLPHGIGQDELRRLRRVARADRRRT